MNTDSKLPYRSVQSNPWTGRTVSAFQSNGNKKRESLSTRSRQGKEYKSELDTHNSRRKRVILTRTGPCVVQNPSRRKQKKSNDPSCLPAWTSRASQQENKREEKRKGQGRSRTTSQRGRRNRDQVLLVLVQVKKRKKKTRCDQKKKKRSRVLLVLGTSRAMPTPGD